MTAKLIHGDCVAAMAAMPADSVDAIVTDPPYGLEFMGKDWDKFRVDPRASRWAAEKSGSAGSGFSTTAMLGDKFPAYHRRRTTRMCRTCGKRDAFSNPHKCGDAADWVTIHVDGIPIEARAFQNWTSIWAAEAYRVIKPGGYALVFGGARTHHRMISGVEDAGFTIRDCLMWLHGQGFPKSMNALGAKWKGWGTALKPAWEAIVVAQKPLDGGYAENLERWGVGALNLNATRIEMDGEVLKAPQSDPRRREGTVGSDLGISAAEPGAFRRAQRESIDRTNTLGRHPADLVLDEEAAAQLDEQSGDLTGGNFPANNRTGFGGVYRGDTSRAGLAQDRQPTDGGGASRFFYTAKADTMDRGLQNTHPTVKPLALMRWLVLLVTPPGGTVLDPFAGSGTTLIAARYAGLEAVGVEREAEYCELARRRFFPEALEVEDGPAGSDFPTSSEVEKQDAAS